MKYFVFLLLVLCPFFIRAQVVDTAAVELEVDSLVQVASELWDAGKGQDALVVAQYLANITKRTWGEESFRYGSTLFRLAIFYEKLGQLDEAESFYLRSTEITAGAAGKEHSNYIKALTNLANLYKRKGDYARAEPLFGETIEIWEKVVGKEHSNYAISLLNLAILYAEKDEYGKAEPLFEQAKEIWAKTLGKEHPYYAHALTGLANLYKNKGDYLKAEKLFFEAIDIRAKSLGKEHPDYGLVLYQIATMYYIQGNYAKAEELFLESKEIQVNALGKGHYNVALALNGLASVYLAKGDYTRAEPMYLEAMDIWLNTYGADHPSYASCLNNLAGLYWEKDDYAKAEQLFLQVREIWEKTQGKEHTNTAEALYHLATLYKDMGEYAKAEKLNLEAKEIWAKILGSQNPAYAQSIHTQALLQAFKGDFETAEQLLFEAIQIRVNAYGKEHPAYAQSLGELAVLYLKTNQIKEATTLYKEKNNLNAYDIENAATYSSESQMLAYLFKIGSDIARFYSFSQTYPNPELSQASFDNALFYNNYLLENARQLSYAVAQADSLTRDVYDRWQGCRRRLANEYTKPVAERKFVAEVEVEAEIYEKTLTRNLPVFSETRRRVQWQDVRDNLRPTEAAVEFIHYRYYNPKATDSTMYAALVLLPTDTAPHFIPLFEERQLLALLNRPGISDEVITKDLYGNRPELYQLLWKPLEPHLRNVKTLYYSPAGLLHRINPAALLDESGAGLAQGRQWVRLGSSRELVTGRLADRSFAAGSENGQNNAANSFSALIYGGITYDMDSLAFANANPVDTSADSLERFSVTGFSILSAGAPEQIPQGIRGDSEDSWAPLPGTAKEAEAIGDVLRKAGFRTELKKGFYASEEQFKKIGVDTSAPHILHLATHGFAYPDPRREAQKGLGDAEPVYKLQDDPMLRSGLLLAGANFYCKNKRPLENREDGVLVAYEVRDLNLRNTELAVLSACQTGLGDVVGTEGVYGLQRAFRIAGAKFLIVSLWPVPDEATRQLMELFYRNWAEKKESLRDAFSHAQESMQAKQPNPYLWAGFVLVE